MKGGGNPIIAVLPCVFLPHLSTGIIHIQNNKQACIYDSVVTSSKAAVNILKGTSNERCSQTFFIARS